MKDRSLILLIVLPLLIAGLFAAYRLATRQSSAPAMDKPTMLREAARLEAERRLGRELTDAERSLIRVEQTPDGGWQARYDEPLHSLIPTRPATTPATSESSPTAPLSR